MISCDPNALAEAAKCFKCIPSGMQSEVITYLLARINGGTTDPDELLALAQRDLCCVPQGLFPRIKTYLLCQIANNASGTFPSPIVLVDAIQELGPIAYWPLFETAGAVAEDLMNLSDGAYTGVTLNNATFPYGGYPVPLLAAGSRINIFNPPLPLAFNGDEGSVLVWVKPTLASLTDGATHHIFSMQSNLGVPKIELFIGPNPYLVDAIHRDAAGLATVTRLYGESNWFQLAWTWNTAANRTRIYFNGTLFAANVGLGPWSGSLTNTFQAIGSKQGSASVNPFFGNIAHCALFDRELLASEIQSVNVNIYPGHRGVLCLGDSKTENDPWPELLSNSMLNGPWAHREDIAIGGGHMDDLAAAIDAALAQRNDTVDTVCIDMGANDIPAPTGQALFKNSLIHVIDSCLAKYPTANVYVARIWRRGFAANVLTINGYINAVIALYPSRVYAGHDESVWLENGDDGVAYTSDGVHYKIDSTVQPIVVAQWMAAFALAP